MFFARAARRAFAWFTRLIGMFLRFVRIDGMPLPECVTRGRNSATAAGAATAAEDAERDDQKEQHETASNAEGETKKRKRVTIKA